MCLIVYKPAGKKMPSFKFLENGYINNPDGAGYMFTAGDKVHIVKGFMTFRAFKQSLKKTIAMYGEKCAYVIHFRLSTQAGKRKDCTHPFPLSKEMNALRKLKTSCEIGIAHNGIIWLTSSTKKDITYNDTMEYITEFLPLIILDKNFYKQPEKLELIKKMTDSKWAILDNEGHCSLIGDGWIEQKGIYYSNDSFMLEQVAQRGYRYVPESVLGQEEAWYNPELQLYEFDELDCPALYDDSQYCSCCVNYYACFGETE